MGHPVINNIKLERRQTRKTVDSALCCLCLTNSCGMPEQRPVVSLDVLACQRLAGLAGLLVTRAANRYSLLWWRCREEEAAQREAARPVKSAPVPVAVLLPSGRVREVKFY